jgi:hypothetical protein
VGILGLSLSGTQTIADLQYKFPFIDSLFARCRKPASTLARFPPPSKASLSVSHSQE